MATACALPCAVLLVLVTGALVVGQPRAGDTPRSRAAPASTPEDALASFRADRALDDVLQRMWLTSPTFRRQCRRLAAAAPAVRLRLRLDGPASSSFRAHSSVQWIDGALASAALYVPLAHDLEELIAHEVEHVLEQVDHVDLAAHVASGAAWRQGSGRFETLRAIEAGRRVAREVVGVRRGHGEP